MSHYCLQISFTNQAWSHLAHTSQDRFAVVRAPIDKLGGCIQATFFTTGRFDLLAIAEFPDHVTPAEDISQLLSPMAVPSPTINTSPLLNFAQAVEARNKELAASSCTIRTQRHLAAVTTHLVGVRRLAAAFTVASVPPIYNSPPASRPRML